MLVLCPIFKVIDQIINYLLRRKTNSSNTQAEAYRNLISGQVQLQAQFVGYANMSSCAFKMIHYNLNSSTNVTYQTSPIKPLFYLYIDHVSPTHSHGLTRRKRIVGGMNEPRVNIFLVPRGLGASPSIFPPFLLRRPERTLVDQMLLNAKIPLFIDISHVLGKTKKKITWTSHLFQDMSQTLHKP